MVMNLVSVMPGAGSVRDYSIAGWTSTSTKPTSAPNSGNPLATTTTVSATSNHAKAGPPRPHSAWTACSRWKPTTRSTLARKNPRWSGSRGTSSARPGRSRSGFSRCKSPLFPETEIEAPNHCDSSTATTHSRSPFPTSATVLFPATTITRLCHSAPSTSDHRVWMRLPLRLPKTNLWTCRSAARRRRTIAIKNRTTTSPCLCRPNAIARFSISARGLLEHLLKYPVRTMWSTDRTRTITHPTCTRPCCTSTCRWAIPITATNLRRNRQRSRCHLRLKDHRPRTNVRTACLRLVESAMPTTAATLVVRPALIATPTSQVTDICTVLAGQRKHACGIR